MRAAHQPWQDRSRGQHLTPRKPGDWQAGYVRPVSPREREVWALLAVGASRQEIARELGITGATVRNHLERLYKALGCQTSGECIALFYGATPYSHREKDTP